jgi:hypothetical protein
VKHVVIAEVVGLEVTRKVVLIMMIMILRSINEAKRGVDGVGRDERGGENPEVCGGRHWCVGWQPPELCLRLG